jgi:hypothetical protein
MNQTDITPALTPDMWKDWRHEMHETEYESLYFAHGAHAVMAFANYNLPDSDPRKITREMVDRLTQAATYIRAETRREYGWDEARWGNVPRHYMAVADGLKSDAAKLAAILPPE